MDEQYCMFFKQNKCISFFAYIVCLLKDICIKGVFNKNVGKMIENTTMFYEKLEKKNDEIENKFVIYSWVDFVNSSLLWSSYSFCR